MQINKPKQNSLPAGVLTGHVFPFVGVKTLKRCVCVCREWRDAVDEDVIWKNQCVILWRNKKNVPKITYGETGEEEPEMIFPFAIYQPIVKLSVKEIKQILAARGVDTVRFIEKNEFQRALQQSQPTRVGDWGAMYPSKWKCSYVYSAICATRDRITRKEVISITWRMEFKHNGMRNEARFNGDGTYWSTLGPIQTNQELRWAFVPNSDGSSFDYPGVRVGEYRKIYNIGFTCITCILTTLLILFN